MTARTAVAVVAYVVRGVGCCFVLFGAHGIGVHSGTKKRHLASNIDIIPRLLARFLGPHLTSSFFRCSVADSLSRALDGLKRVSAAANHLLLNVSLAEPHRGGASVHGLYLSGSAADISVQFNFGPGWAALPARSKLCPNAARQLALLRRAIYCGTCA